jgi:adenylosuccinate lyase
MIERYTPAEFRELWSEANRYRAWLAIELAALRAWEQLGEVPAGTHDRMANQAADHPLDEAFALRVAELEAVTRHDIVAFIRALSERYGDDARHIHRGLTSTDVVDSAQNLLLVRACKLIQRDVASLNDVVRDLAIEHRYTPVIGRTHGIHAEPMTFGLKFLNFHAALNRDQQRLTAARKGLSVIMLSGSVGTFAHVPPEVEELVAEQLGMQVDPVSNQTVARDRHAQLLSALAILGTTLERIALEIRHLQRTEVREAQEGFERGQAGSSSMPHKKNPIATENISGLVRLMRSNLQAALENVALWHERDISHSSVERIILPDTTSLASYATRRLTGVLRNLVVHPENMRHNLDLLRGLGYSQRVLYLLLDAGMSRQDAYELVQDNSLRCWDEGVPLQELIEADPRNPLEPQELAEAFSEQWYLRNIDAIYARFDL